VETKTQNALEVDQIEMYLDLARELEFRPLFRLIGSRLFIAVV
jgi:hypothetical protein